MIDFNIGVVIPAAGKSERCCGGTPKQYFSVMGKPLVLYCLENFLNLPFVKKVCLVSDRVEYLEHLLELHGIKQDKVIVVSGANSRHLSIKNGLNALEKLDMYLKVVVIHDGARPLVPKRFLEELIAEAATHGAAGATRPLTSTILRPQTDGCLDLCLDRSSYIASETPQAFLFEMLCDAYQKCDIEELESGTECLQLALNYCGVRAKLIPGPESLWKVTEKKDCYSAAATLRESENDVMGALRDALEEKVAVVACHVVGNEEKPDSMYNTVICLHDREIDQDSQILLLADVLDIETPGLIVHVVLEGAAEGLASGSVYDLLRSGRSMMHQYEKLKKGVVMIHFTSPGEEKRLVEMLVSLLLSDWNVFSGQTFFL